MSTGGKKEMSPDTLLVRDAGVGRRGGSMDTIHLENLLHTGEIW